jgi:sugar/nucleoside kinase (ribokinase family)
MKILTIGGATQDIFILYEDAETLHLHTKRGKESYLLLKEGGKLEVKELIYSSGGGANNAAFSFKKQGFDVSPVLKVANDEQGTFVIDKLKEAGINTQYVVSVAGHTGLSFIIPSLEHDRTVFAFRGVNGTMSEEDIPFDDFDQYNYLYITSLSGGSSQLLLSITQQAKKLQIPVAINPGASQLVAGAPTLCKSLLNIDILIINSSEAKKFMLSLAHANEHLHTTLKKKGKKIKTDHRPILLEESINIEDIWFSINNFFQAVLAQGPRIVVVTNGAEGVYVATGQTVYFHPSLPIKVVNTLGAGDAFGSSFVGAIASGKSIESAIRHGICNAASVISFMDTKQGLLSMKELEKKAQELDPHLLQQFKLVD